MHSPSNASVSGVILQFPFYAGMPRCDQGPNSSGELSTPSRTGSWSLDQFDDLLVLSGIPACSDFHSVGGGMGHRGTIYHEGRQRSRAHLADRDVYTSPRHFRISSILLDATLLGILG